MPVFPADLILPDPAFLHSQITNRVRGQGAGSPKLETHRKFVIRILIQKKPPNPGNTRFQPFLNFVLPHCILAIAFAFARAHPQPSGFLHKDVNLGGFAVLWISQLDSDVNVTRSTKTVRQEHLEEWPTEV